MIVITHDEQIALQADRIIRLEDGRIVSDSRNRPAVLRSSGTAGKRREE